jgi:hypothetical protein
VGLLISILYNNPYLLFFTFLSRPRTQILHTHFQLIKEQLSKFDLVKATMKFPIVLLPLLASLVMAYIGELCFDGDVCCNISLTVLYQDLSS